LRKTVFFLSATLAMGLDGASAGKLHRDSCHMDTCSWSSVEAKDAVGSNAQSSLFKITLKIWTSQHPHAAYDKKAPLSGGETLSVYYNCSKARPAYIEAADGKWTATTLNLYNPPGYQDSAVTQYFVVCHGFDIDASKSSSAAAARKFGYRRMSDTPEAIALSKPEDILTR
jgi:hypothetical protein